MQSPRVLELGTHRVVGKPSTIRRSWAPHASEYIGTDIQAGPDVDIVADVHRLSTAVGNETFDAIVSCSSFEHLKYPHVAAHELMKVLRVGGILFLQTHHTFVLHGYPHDYFRFSREALAGLFGTRMGFEVVGTGYDFPAAIWARRNRDKQEPAFLNSTLFGRKTGTTPAEYIFEYDYPPAP